MIPLDNLQGKGVISADELVALLDTSAAPVKMVDASMSMPSSPISAIDSFRHKRIGNAVYFDIDDVADANNPLPHMLPSPGVFETKIGAMGIGNDDIVIVYDQHGIGFAAARAWWMFRVFGHRKVYVLNGGLPYWEARGHKIIDTPPIKPPHAVYKAIFHDELVADMAAISNNIETAQCALLDARDQARFDGHSAPGSGHIPRSLNLFFMNCINQDGCLKSKDELEPFLSIFPQNKKIITTCGSGVTACIVTLALYEMGIEDAAVYDGSWSEWSQPQLQNPVARS